MKKVYVIPSDSRKVWLSDLGGPLPENGLYVAKSKEVDEYLKEGMIKLIKIDKPKSKGKK